MANCSATHYGLISRIRPYRDLQTSWLNMAGIQPRLFSAAKVPRRRNESLPRAEKKKKNQRRFRRPLRHRPAHMESGLCIFHVSNFCRYRPRFRAAAAPRIWIDGFTIGYSIDKQTNKQNPWRHWLSRKRPQTFFYDFRSAVK